jgi:hypothetical protein
MKRLVTGDTTSGESWPLRVLDRRLIDCHVAVRVGEVGTFQRMLCRKHGVKEKYRATISFKGNLYY